MAALSGDPGWSWNGLSYHTKVCTFRKKHSTGAEGSTVPSFVPDGHDMTGEFIPSAHGTTGPVNITRSNYPWAVQRLLIEGASQVPK